MTSDQRRLRAEEIYRTILEAQRDDSDSVLSEALDMLAADTGLNKFRHAASVLRGRALGRRAIDDRAALRHVAALAASRPHEAVGIVAGQVAGPGAGDKRVATIANRLRRKLRKNKTGKIVITAASVS